MEPICFSILNDGKSFGINSEVSDLYTHVSIIKPFSFCVEFLTGVDVKTGGLLLVSYVTVNNVPIINNEAVERMGSFIQVCIN